MVAPKCYILVPLQIIDKFIQWSQQIIIQRDLETLYSCMSTIGIDYGITKAARDISAEKSFGLHSLSKKIA